MCVHGEKNIFKPYIDMQVSIHLSVLLSIGLADCPSIITL